MRTFTISDEQEARVKAWQGLGHGCKLSIGTIGDREHYRICPTGIGDFIVVVCSCGVELDLNDYDTF